MTITLRQRDRGRGVYAAFRTVDSVNRRCHVEIPRLVIKACILREYYNL